MRLNECVRGTTESPIGATFELLERCSGDVLDLAQAAPRYPPAPEVVDSIVGAVRSASGAEYTEIAGLPALRAAFGAELSTAYHGTVGAEQVVITAGCNQAFCLAVSALAVPGDEIVVALPYYFNHDMWLRMSGIVARYLEPGPDLAPTVEAAERLLTRRTRAIVLVTPGNPTGLSLSPDLLEQFLDLARRHGIALVLDETYRSFRGTDEPAHLLFTDAGWTDTLVSLHSFSKDLALPGYRVGAIVASGELQREVTKLLDCVAICAPRVGQEAVLAGLREAGAWRTARAAELSQMRADLAAVMGARPGGFELLALGGFFGWVRHPFGDRPTDEVARDLALEHGVLVVPGTAFLPDDRSMFRVSVSNLGHGGAAELADRLAAAGGRPSVDDAGIRRGSPRTRPT